MPRRYQRAVPSDTREGPLPENAVDAATAVDQLRARLGARYPDFEDRLPWVRRMSRLAAHRRSLGLTQADVARRMDVPQSVVGRLESGATDPQVSTWERYLDALGLKAPVVQPAISVVIEFDAGAVRTRVSARRTSDLSGAVDTPGETFVREALHHSLERGLAAVTREADVGLPADAQEQLISRALAKGAEIALSTLEEDLELGVELSL